MATKYKSGRITFKPGNSEHQLFVGKYSPPVRLTDEELQTLHMMLGLIIADRRPATPEAQMADQIQRIQDELYYLFRADNLQDEQPDAFHAGLLAWEAVRLFWYFFVTGHDGGKFDQVSMAFNRLKARFGGDR